MARRPAARQPSTTLHERLERWGVLILALVLVLLPMFFWTGTRDKFELPKLTLLRLLSVALVVCWVAAQAVGGTLRWRRTPLDLPLLLWCGWLIVKTVHSVAPAVSWRGEYENFAGSLTQLNYCLLLFVAVQLVREAGTARRLLFAFELTCVGVGVYGLFQAMNVDFIRWSARWSHAPRHFSSMGNPNFFAALMVMGLALVAGRAMDRSREAPRRDLWRHWLYLAALPLLGIALYFVTSASAPGVRASAVIAGAERDALVTLALYLGGVVVLGLLLMRKQTRAARDLTLGVEAFVLFKAIFATGTRGAFAGLLATAGFMVAMGVAGWWETRATGSSAMRRTVLASGVAVVVMAALAAASVALSSAHGDRMRDTLRSPLRTLMTARGATWIPALKIVRDHPLAGTGVDTFKTVFPRYADRRIAQSEGENVASRTAHSEPLQILATMGLIGLTLWIWLLAAWALAFWRRWRDDVEARPWVVALGGLVAGYLVQNLVSFGVAAISAPFFVVLGFLWAGTETPAWTSTMRRLRWPMLAGLVLWAGFGARAAVATFRADTLSNFGNITAAQTRMLDKAGLEDSRAALDYALAGIAAYPEVRSDVQGRESRFWLSALERHEKRLEGHPARDAIMLGYTRRAARPLLLALSTLKQEEAVALCPGEVKYHAYLGLAYEELHRYSSAPSLRAIWLDRAEASYGRALTMSPDNAYYHGNLGRIYAVRAKAGDGSYAALSEAQYLDAVALAPGGRLFYEQLILLYAETGKQEKGLELIEPVETTSAARARDLYLFASRALYKASQAARDKGQDDSALKAAGLEARTRALRLASPKNKGESTRRPRRRRARGPEESRTPKP